MITRLPFAVIFALGCQPHHESSSSAPAVTRSAAAGTPSSTRPGPVSSVRTPAPQTRAQPFTLPPETSFDGLPVVEPAPCSDGGARAFVAVPRDRWKPILEAAIRDWPKWEYPPNDCLLWLRARCAPDLDGAPGPEELVEIAYRVPLDGVIETQHPLSPTCGSKDRGTQAVILALSPPSKQGGEWSSHGSVGFARSVTGERAWELAMKGFVQLPNGWTGIRAHAVQPGFAMQYDLVIAYDSASGDGPAWRNVGVHDIPPADGAGP